MGYKQAEVKLQLEHGDVRWGCFLTDTPSGWNQGNNNPVFPSACDLLSLFTHGPGESEDSRDYKNKRIWN